MSTRSDEIYYCFGCTWTGQAVIRDLPGQTEICCDSCGSTDLKLMEYDGPPEQDPDTIGEPPITNEERLRSGMVKPR